MTDQDKVQDVRTDPDMVYDETTDDLKSFYNRRFRRMMENTDLIPAN